MNQAWTKLKLNRSVPIAILVAVALFVGATQGRTLWNELFYNYLNRGCNAESAPSNPSSFVPWWTSRAFENDAALFQTARKAAAKYINPETEVLLRRTFWLNTDKALPIDIIVPQHYFVDNPRGENSFEVARVIVDLSKPEMPHLYLRIRFDLEKIDGQYKIAKIALKDGGEAKIQKFLRNVSSNPDPNIVRRNEAATKQFRRGVIWERSSQEIAEEELEKALDINPCFALAHIDLGHLALQSGDNFRAAAQFQVAIACDPLFVLGHMELSDVYMKISDADLALQEAIQAAKVDPRFSMAFAQQARANCELGQCQTSLNNLTHAIELDPEYSVAYINRGIENKNLGKNQDSLNDLNKAISLYPNRADWYELRAELFCRMKDAKSAHREITHAMELDPNDPHFYCTRSWAYAVQSDFKNAMREAEKAIELAPQMGYAYRRRACLKFDMKDFRGAFEDFNSSIKLDPNDLRSQKGRADSLAELAKRYGKKY